MAVFAMANTAFNLLLMSFYSAYPSEKLKPFIKQYWAIECALGHGDPYTYRIVPTGLPELILYIDYKPLSQNRTLEENFLLNGQHNNYYDLLISGNLSVFSILFQPQGLSQFFKLPLYELTNLSVPLKYINKKISYELQCKLSETISFQNRIDIAEKHFYHLIADNNNSFEFQRINQTIELIRKNKGNIDIDTLSQYVCLSRKQFERKFLEFIGISPKQYLKTIRFQAAIYFKSRNAQLSMTELAYESGYYDQSHFINDFKKLSGLTPKLYFEENCDFVSDFFD